MSWSTVLYNLRQFHCYKAWPCKVVVFLICLSATMEQIFRTAFGFTDTQLYIAHFSYFSSPLYITNNVYHSNVSPVTEPAHVLFLSQIMSNYIFLHVLPYAALPPF